MLPTVRPVCYGTGMETFYCHWCLSPLLLVFSTWVDPDGYPTCPDGGHHRACRDVRADVLNGAS